jgi:GH15 family glucan-1,4-alpha-glucosidase
LARDGTTGRQQSYLKLWLIRLGANLEFAPIGNGRICALVTAAGSIDWWCFPRLDGDPVFCRLVSGTEDKGFCDVLVANLKHAKSAYIRNTAVIETDLEDEAGNVVRITDFAPRFQRYERIFNPAQIWRRIEPLNGVPQITIRARPTFNYGKPALRRSTGSNHITYTGGSENVRLTTDASLSYITDEAPFALTHPVSLVFGPDEPLDAAVHEVSRDFLDRTKGHWLQWVRGLGVPYEWQAHIIRAAITLKLCSFDETGAIIAAPTTSIPEAPNSRRNWDYRYCWLRDAHFVIKALNRLGATHTMESYLNYITTVAVNSDGVLKPVYGIVHTASLEERIAPDLQGYLGMGPVRLGNQAAEQLQHDSYGSIILGVSNMFIDERLPRMGDIALFRQLETLGEHARRFVMESDAGLWEYRGRQRVHTYSATMCWVACDRLSRIAARLCLDARTAYWRNHADKLRRAILERAWNAKRGVIAGALDDDELDASVLLLPELGFIAPSDERFIATCEAIGRDLNRHGYIMRYTAADDFGLPETAFLVCQFWYIDALCMTGRTSEARELFSDLLRRRNSFGLLSEDINPATGELWGNMPQTYSMAGIINTGMSLSRKWEDGWHDAV